MACNLNRWSVGLISILWFCNMKGVEEDWELSRNVHSRLCLLTRKQKDFCSFIPLSPQRETERREMKTGAGRERVGVFLKGLEDRKTTGLK